MTNSADSSDSTSASAARPAPASTAPLTARTARGIDPRGPRFGAALMTVLLAATVLAGTSTTATVLLAIAVAAFALGAVRGAQGTVQGWLFTALVRPRLAPPTELEDPAPPRFAQRVGLVITGLGLLLGLSVTPVAIPVAAGVALVAAFLNAAFNVCLGCQMYIAIQRLTPGRAAA